MDHQPHPLQPWLDEHQQDFELLARLCRRAGWKTKAVYLKQIACGYYRPKFDRCRTLASVVGGSVTAESIYDFPYTLRGKDAA